MKGHRGRRARPSRQLGGQAAPWREHGREDLIPDLGWAKGFHKAFVLVLQVKLKWMVVEGERLKVPVLTGAASLHGMNHHPRWSPPGASAPCMPGASEPQEPPPSLKPHSDSVETEAPLGDLPGPSHWAQTQNPSLQRGRQAAWELPGGGGSVPTAHWLPW